MAPTHLLCHAGQCPADAHELVEAVRAGKDAAFYVSTSEEYEDGIKAELATVIAWPRRRCSSR